MQPTPLAPNSELHRRLSRLVVSTALCFAQKLFFVFFGVAWCYFVDRMAPKSPAHDPGNYTKSHEATPTNGGLKNFSTVGVESAFDFLCKATALLVAVAFLSVASLPLIATGSVTDNVRLERFRGVPASANYPVDAPLFGRKWRLTHIGSDAVKTTKPYIELDAQTKRFAGDGGCNRMSGAVEVNRNQVKFSGIISTKRACLDRQLQQVETKFMAGLERTSTFFIKDDVMRFYAAGVAVLTFRTEAAGPVKPAKPAKPAKPVSRTLQPNSLCEQGEQIIFSCRLKRPTKIVSLCASPDLDRERGYLQYRFGLPTRIELEFPKTRQSTQEQFQYSHYFRYQVDLTEINFAIAGNQYQIFDAYNGEEKPRVIQYGVQIVPEKRASVSYHCRSKPKADYSRLDDALREH